MNEDSKLVTPRVLGCDDTILPVMVRSTLYQVPLVLPVREVNDAR